LVGGGDDGTGRPGVGLADGGVDVVGVLRVRRDAVDAIEVPITQPIGQGDPNLVGIIPTIRPSHVGTGVDETLGGQAVNDPRDGPACWCDDTLPGVGLSENQRREAEQG
jgi:hypothetical protein